MAFRKPGKVQEITLALVTAVNDGEPKVKGTMVSSLLDIGRRQPEILLTVTSNFIKEQKPARDHRVILLNIMVEVIQLSRDNLPDELCTSLIDLSVSEMVAEKEVLVDWQGAVSKILVLLGQRFPGQVLSQLMKNFPSGSTPHYFVMKTLGDMASTNVMDVVPQMKEILARTLPVLSGINRDNMKWVFGASMASFCEAITTYVANLDKASDKTISCETFSAEFVPAYEILFNHWLKSSESKVRIASVNAIGNMAAVLPKEHLEAQLPKLLPFILALFKKEKEQLPITQAISIILSVVAKIDTLTLVMQPLLQPLFQTLHPYACAPVEFDDAAKVKNYNELLRCWELLGRTYSDTLAFLLNQLQSKDARIRSGTLAIVRHLINRLVDELSDKKELIVSGVRPLVSETTLSVKKPLAQVIIAMASHDYLNLEGGEALVEFIVRHCATSDSDISKANAAALQARQGKKPAPDEVTLGELRSMSDNILNLCTTTIPEMEPVLWPYLLEFIVPVQYTEALAGVCKSIAFIASNKRENDDEMYLVDFEREVNLPRPQAVIVRLMVMLNAPTRRGNLGIMILEAMKSIGPVLRQTVAPMWDNAIPKLITYLENNLAKGEDAWKPAQWEELVLRLLAETIKLAADDDWTLQLGECLTSQLDSYKGEPQLKKVALKHLGLILQKINKKDFIRQKLDVMLNSVDHSNEVERLGCAQAFGFCAAAHLDLTVEKLVEHIKGGGQKKQESSGGFFSFLSGSSSNTKLNTGASASTVMLCLGYVCAYAPSSLTTSRLEISVVPTIQPYLTSRVITIQENVIKAIDLIGKALHPNHLRSKEKYTFKQRDEYVKALIGYMVPAMVDKKSSGTEGEPPVTIRSAALEACSTLIALEPLLPTELESELLEKTMNFYFTLAIPTGQEDAFKTLTDNFNEMLSTILTMNTSTAVISGMLKKMENYLSASPGIQRQRATHSALHVLKKYIELKANGEGSEKTEKSFDDLGNNVALFVPRSCDSIVEIRQNALEVIESILYIDNCIKTGSKDPVNELQVLIPARERTASSELQEHFAAIQQLTLVVAQLVTAQELPTLLLKTLKALTDPEPSSSAAVCILLNGIYKVRGEELLPKVSPLVQAMLLGMTSIKDDRTMKGTLNSLRTLSVHHLIPVVEELLTFPLPQAENVKSAFGAIAKDQQLVVRVIGHLLNIMNNSHVIEDDSLSSKSSMAATCSLTTLLQLEEMEPVALQFYPQLIGSILLRFGTTNNLRTKEAPEQASALLKIFLERTKDDEINSMLTETAAWNKLESSEYHLVLTDISTLLSRNHKDHLPAIFAFLQRYLKANFQGQRVVTATVYAEFINHVKEDRTLLQNLINALLSIMSEETTKLQVLRGLGNIASAGVTEVNRYAPTVIDALMCAIDDANETIAREAINGLSKIFELVDEGRVAPILVNTCHRIKPAFEKLNDKIRAYAFTLFGTMWRFGRGVSQDIFLEQIHSNLPSIFLHLFEENVEVQNACKKALRQLAPLLKSEELSDLFTRSYFDEGKPVPNEAFLLDLAKAFINNFPDRVNFYVMASVEQFKSPWNSIRVAALQFVGFSLGNVMPEKRDSFNLSPGLVIAELIKMLKHSSPPVRLASANSLSLLFHY